MQAEGVDELLITSGLLQPNLLPNGSVLGRSPLQDFTLLLVNARAARSHSLTSVFCFL